MASTRRRLSEASATRLICSGRLSTPTLGCGPFSSVLPAELGGDHHLSLERLQRFADQFLVRERPIHFRRIEEGDAALDSLVKKSDHLLFVGRLVAKTHSHAAEPES